MKKLLTVLAITLALNFLAVVGAVGWLYQQGRLTPQNIAAIREILFPPPPPPAEEAPVEQTPENELPLRLEDLLAQQAGRPATEQVEFIQRAFDSQMALLDRRHRELLDLQRQVEAARAQLERDSQALARERAALEAEKQQAQRLAADKGFQDALQRYEAMPAREVKDIFVTLDDQVVVQYLQAMDARMAARIMKECKSAEEIQWAQRIMEQMRLASTAP